MKIFPFLLSKRKFNKDEIKMIEKKLGWPTNEINNINIRK
tara:strand:- start:15 stop:134 length:120 start_codon:yes stop_codon:yes gene_type:complete